MRVLFVNSLYADGPTGGAEATLRGLAEALVARGWQASVAALTPQRRPRTERLAGVEVRYLPSPTGLWPFGPRQDPIRRTLFQLSEVYNPLAERRIGRVLDDIRPDVVHVHNFKGFSALAVWRAARRRGVPVLQTLHDYTLACPRSVMFKAGTNCARQCASCRAFTTTRRWTSYQPEGFTAVSRRQAARLSAAGSPRTSASTVIIRGENPKRQGGEPSRPPPDSRFTLGVLGRMDRIKGVEVAIAALAALPQFQVTLLIAGDGDPAYVEDLRSQAGGDPRIVFVGRVRAELFLPSLDLLIAPSLWEEPLGRVVHEAFGFGVPVVASRIGGIPEIVEDGVNGALFEPGRADELSALLRRLAADPPALAALRRGALASGAAFAADHIHDQYEAALRKTATDGVAGPREVRRRHPTKT